MQSPQTLSYLRLYTLYYPIDANCHSSSTKIILYTFQIYDVLAWFFFHLCFVCYSNRMTLVHLVQYIAMPYVNWEMVQFAPALRLFVGECVRFPCIMVVCACVYSVCMCMLMLPINGVETMPLTFRIHRYGCLMLCVCFVIIESLACKIYNLIWFGSVLVILCFELETCRTQKDQTHIKKLVIKEEQHIIYNA